MKLQIRICSYEQGFTTENTDAFCSNKNLKGQLLNSANYRQRHRTLRWKRKGVTAKVSTDSSPFHAMIINQGRHSDNMSADTKFNIQCSWGFKIPLVKTLATLALRSKGLGFYCSAPQRRTEGREVEAEGVEGTAEQKSSDP